MFNELFNWEELIHSLVIVGWLLFSIMLSTRIVAGSYYSRLGQPTRYWWLCMIAYFFIIYGVYHYLGFLAALMAAGVLLGIQSIINRLEGHEFIQVLFIFIATVFTGFVAAILYFIESGGFS